MKKITTSISGKSGNICFKPKRSKYFILMSVFALVLMFLSAYAWTLPNSGNVVAGQANISYNGHEALIQQNSDRAIINWNGFSINVNELVKFQQPGISSAVLNRVTGGEPSAILGQLAANGRVFLVNSNGILFGAGSKIDVGSLAATTFDINNGDFLGDKLKFEQVLGKDPSFVINRGEIKVAENGFVFLVAPSVNNEGLIIAKMGKVVLGSGSNFTMDFNGNGLIKYEVSGKVMEQIQGPDGEKLVNSVYNKGTIRTNGGQTVLTGNAARDIVSSVVCNDGLIEVQSFEDNIGSVILEARSEGSPAEGKVINSGTINVSASYEDYSGGEVTITGGKVGQFGEIHADGSGIGDGGKVNLYAEDTLALSSDSLTTANAGTVGSGGEVIAFSPDTALFWKDAKIEAKGGSISGDGGFVEVSGQKHVEINGLVDASAINGEAGTFLIDPYDITIEVPGSDSGGAWVVGPPDTWTASADNSTVMDTTIESLLNAGTSVTIQTANGGGGETGTGTITQDAAATIGFTGGGGVASLTLNAANNIVLNGGISASGAALTVTLNANSSAGGTSTGTGSVDINAPIVTNGGIFTSTGVDFDNTGGTIATLGGNVNISNTNNITLGGNIDVIGGAATIVTIGSAFTAGAIFNGGGSIIMGSGDLVIQASTGIGTAITPIATMSVTDVAAVTNTGGIFINNNNATDINVTTLSGVIGFATTTSGDISIVNTVGGVTLTNGISTAGDGTVTITNAGLLDIAGGADMSLDGAFLQDGAGSVQTAGDITTTGDDITFLQDVTLTDNLAVAFNTGAGAGTIAFNDTLDGTGVGTENLTLTAGTGNINFNAIVGATSLGDVTINSAADVTAVATFDADSLTQLAGTGTTTFSNVVVTNGNNGTEGVNITTSGAGGIAFNNTLNTNGNPVILQGDEITLPTTLTATGSTVILRTNSGIAINIADAVLTGLNFTDASLDNIEANSITIGSAMATTLTVGSAMTQNQDMILISGGAMDIDNTIGITAGNINVTAVGAVDIDAAITTAGGTFTSTGVNFDNTGGIITTGGGAVDIQNTGDITLGANIDVSGGAGNVTIDGNGAPTSSITGSGTIIMGTGDLLLQASTGIGTVGTPIATLGLTDVAATTVDGGIYIENTGSSVINVATVGGINGFSITSGDGDISIKNTDANIRLALPISTAGNGAITLDTNKAIVTINGGIITMNGGVLSLTGGDGIGTVANQIHTRGSINVEATTTTGDIYIENSTSAGNFIVNGFTTTSGDISITNSVGNITLAQPILTTSNGFVILDAGTNGIDTNDQTISTGSGAISFTSDTIDLGITINKIITTGSVTLQPTTVGTAIGIGDGAAGAYQLVDAEIAAIKDGTSGITIGRADGTHAITINEITFNDPVTIQGPVAGGSIIVAGKITGADDASVTLDGPGAATTLNADIITAGNFITISDSITLGADVLLDTNATTAAGDITIGDVAGATFDLTLDTGHFAGADISGAIVNNVDTLTIIDAGTADFSGAIDTNVAVAITDAVTLVDFVGAVTTPTLTVGSGGYAVNLTGTGGIIDNTVTFANTGALTLGRAAGTLTFDGGLVATVNSARTVFGTIDSSDDVMNFGTITLGADTVLDTHAVSNVGDLTIGDVTGAGFNLNVDTGHIAGADISGGAVTNVDTLTIVDSGTTTFSGAIGATTAVAITDAVTLVDFQGAVNTPTLTVPGTGTAYNVNLTGTGGVITNAVNFANTGTVTLGDQDIDSNIFIGGLSTAAGPSVTNIAGTVNTTNTDMDLGVTTLTANVTLNTDTGAGAITFASTLDGMTAFDEDLELTAGTGNIDFDGIVGGVIDLGAVTINTATDVTIDVAFNAKSLTQLAGTGDTWFTALITLTDGLNIAANNILFGADGNVTTVSGNIKLDATTAITMADGTILDAGDSDLDLDASADITIGRLVTTNNTATAVDINTTGGAILDAGDVSGADIEATGDDAIVTMRAETGIGHGDAIETNVANISIDNDASNNIWIAETNALNIDKIVQATAGNIIVNADGLITVTTDAGMVYPVSAAGTGTITLDANNVASMIINDGIESTSGNIILTADDDATFGADGDITSTSGNITVTADADRDDDGDGGALFMANGTLIKTGSGIIALNADEDITIGVLQTDSAAVDAVTITTTSGGVVDGGTDDVSDVNAPNGTLVIASATGVGSINNLDTTVDSINITNTAGTIQINETDTLNIVGIVQGSGDFVKITATDVNISGNVSGTGDITLQPHDTTSSIGIAGGAGDFQLSAADISNLVDGFSNIIIGRLFGVHDIVINAITFNDPVTIQTPNGGSIAVDGQITGLDNASIMLHGSGATTTLNANIVTAGNPITIDDTVILGAATVKLDTTNGWNPAHVGGAVINITGTVTGGGNGLTLISGNAATTMDPALNNIGTLTLQGDDPDATGAMTFNGDVTATALTTYAQAYAVAFNEDTTITSDTTFLNTGGVTLGDTVGDILTFTGGLNTTFGVTTTAGTVNTTNTQMDIGALTLTADTTLDTGTAAASIMNIGVVNNGGNALVVDSGAAALITIDSFAGGGNLTVTDSGDTTITNAINAGTVTLTDTTGIVTFEDVVTINMLVTTANAYAVALNEGGTITVDTTFLNTGGVTLGNEDSDNLLFTGGLSTVAGNTTAAGTITTTGQDIDIAALNITDATTITTGAASAGNINITGAVTGTATDDLSLISGAGATTVTGSVGAGSQIATLTLQANDAAALGAMTFNGDVTATTLTTYAQGYAVALNEDTTITDDTTFLNTGGVTLGSDGGDALLFVGGLSTVAGNTTAAGTITTTGQDIDIVALKITDTTTITTGAAIAGNINITGAVTGTSADDLSLISGTGTTTVTGSVGAGTQIVTLTLQSDTGTENGTMTFNGDVTATALTTYAQAYAVALNEDATITNDTTFNNTNGVTLGNAADDALLFTGGLSTVASDTTAAGTITTTGQDIDIAALNITDTTILDSTNGWGTPTGAAINITGTVTGGTNNLTLISGNAATTMDSALNNIGILTLQGNDVDALGSMIFNGDVTATTLTTFGYAYAVALNEDAMITDDTTFNNTNGVTLGSGGGDALLFVGGLSTVAGDTKAAGTITTTGQDIDIAALNITDTTTITTGAAIAGNINITGAVTGTSADDLSLISGTGTTTVDGSVGAGSQIATLTLQSDTGTETGTMIFNGDVTATALTTYAQAYAVALNEDTTIIGDTTFLNTGGVTLGNAFDDALLFVGGLNTVAGNTTAAGTITTTGQDIDIAALNITDTTTITTGAAIAGNINITGAVTGTTADDLSLISGIGTTTVDGSVGAGSQIATLTLQSDIGTETGTMTFNGDVTATALTTYAQAYAVALNEDATITNDTTFLNTGSVTLGSGGGDNLLFTGGLDTTNGPSGTNIAGTVITTDTIMDLGATILTANSTVRSGTGAINIASVTDGGSSYTLGLGDGSQTGAITAIGNMTVSVLDTFNSVYNVLLQGAVNVIDKDTNFLNTGTVTLGNDAADSTTFTGGLDTTTGPSGTNIAGTVATIDNAMDLGITTMTANSTVTSGSGDINIASLAGAFTLSLQDALIASTGNITVAGAATIGGLTTFAGAADYDVTLNGGGTITNDTNFVNAGTVTLGNDIGDTLTFIGGLDTTNGPSGTNIAGTVITTNTLMDLGATTLTANSAVTSGTGAINMASVTDGANSYTLGLGDVSQTGAITAIGNMTVSDLDTFNSAYNVLLQGAANVIDTDTNFLNTGTVTLGNDAADSTTFTGGLDTTNGPGSTNVAGAVVTTNTNMDLGTTILTTDALLDTGVAAGNITVTGKIDGNVAGTNSLIVRSGTGNVDFQQAIGSLFALDGFGIKANSLVTQLTDTSNDVNTLAANITTGDFNFKDADTLEIGTVGPIHAVTVTDVTTNNSDISIKAADAINQNADILLNGNGDLDITATNGNITMALGTKTEITGTGDILITSGNIFAMNEVFANDGDIRITASKWVTDVNGKEPNILANELHINTDSVDRTVSDDTTDDSTFLETILGDVIPEIVMFNNRLMAGSMYESIITVQNYLSSVIYGTGNVGTLEATINSMFFSFSFRDFIQQKVYYVIESLPYFSSKFLFDPKMEKTEKEKKEKKEKKTKKVKSAYKQSNKEYNGLAAR